MSGAPAAVGQSTQRAIEVGVRELNAAGGLLGIPVEPVFGDDRCDAGMAVSVARRQVEQDKINVVIGPICPAVAADAAPIYAKAGVIQLLPTVTSVDITRRRFDNIFRMAATDEQEAQAVGAYLARDYQGKKVAVIYGDFFYKRAMADLVRQALPAQLKQTARFEPLQEVPGSFDRMADNLKREPPDVIYIALDVAPMVEFVGKLRARGVKSLLIGGQHLLSRSFWRASQDVVDGIHVIAPIRSLTDVEFRKAVDLLRQADVIPDLVALYSYASVQTWAEAVRRAGTGDPKKVIETLRSGEFETAIGTVAFDARGDRRNLAFSVLTWQAGRLVQLGTLQ